MLVSTSYKIECKEPFCHDTELKFVKVIEIFHKDMVDI